jgi:tRNA-uridine 2-sulfurtransferase
MSAKKKVVVAMSGGVDSSVAAALLQRQGYDCIGVFMRLGNDPAEETSPTACRLPLAPPSPTTPQNSTLKTQDSRLKSHQGCCSASDAADARFVAGLLNIPFYALNFQPDFNQIIDYFVAEYNSGRTPNPCVRCNTFLKFGKLARYARALKADFVATGHYARIQHPTPDNPQNGESYLLRARDLKKDQSYVLFGIPRDELPRMLLPLGDLEKSAVRQIARDLGLPVHDKPDSQEICFVPDNDYARLVQAKSPAAVRPGNFIAPDGHILGQHPGHQHFTLGQRKGTRLALGQPAYVAAIDPTQNTVTLAPKEALLHRSLTARQINWLADVASASRRRSAGISRGPTEPLPVLAKVRYNSPPTPATALLTGPDELTVRFADPVLAITPGQAVVCYDQATNRLLGGAWIHSVSD